MATLKQRLEAHAAAAAKKIPPADQEVLKNATQALRDSGIVDRVVAPGTPLPPFELVDSTGVAHRSTDKLATGPLVLTFYRGVW